MFILNQASVSELATSYMDLVLFLLFVLRDFIPVCVV